MVDSNNDSNGNCDGEWWPNNAFVVVIVVVILIDTDRNCTGAGGHDAHANSSTAAPLDDPRGATNSADPIATTASAAAPTAEAGVIASVGPRFCSVGAFDGTGNTDHQLPISPNDVVPWEQR